VACRRSSPLGAREHESKLRLHQETQEDIADLLGPRTHVGDGRWVVLVRDLRRADGVEVGPNDSHGPGTNREGGELQEREGKLKEEIGKKEVVCSSYSTWRWPRRHPGRSG
jgi:hypothetical protein